MNYGAAHMQDICCKKWQLTTVITFDVVDRHLKMKPDSDFYSSIRSLRKQPALSE